MRVEVPFNPLDKKNLGSSVADALLAQKRNPLPPSARFIAAGVYAIYYRGYFEHYASMGAQNRGQDGKSDLPIYVGKAVPKGARKGGLGFDASMGTVLSDRLKEHAESIGAAKNLEIDDFFCRFLAVDDIWIPLGESLLIEMFSPLWNRCIDGFGNHDPGAGRYQGKMPSWDVLHPGHPWAARLQAGKKLDVIVSDVTHFFNRRP